MPLDSRPTWKRKMPSICHHVMLLVAVLQGTFFWQDGEAAAQIGPDPTATQPYFSTVGQSYRVKTHDTVVLPCEVINPGHYMLVWKKGIAVLAAGPTKVTPDNRIRLVDGYNLEISNVQTQDAGDYACQIATLQPIEIIHTVEILVPPRIDYVSSDGTRKGAMEVKKGSAVTLECRASGNPVPTITWTRRNNLLPSGEKTVKGTSITIEQANRHQAGVYQCTASNGVGEPVTQNITLNVLYAPEIEVERGWVHSGEGNEAQLACIVHAEPPAEVLWYRDTMRLDTTERRIMEARGSRHTLIIRKVQASDFANYTCMADNQIGKTRQKLELSGRPNPAIFVSDPRGKYRDMYNISWNVNSYTPIEEFKLSFRKLPVSSPQALPGHQQPPPPQQQLQPPPNNRRQSRKDNDTYSYTIYGHPALRSDWNDVILSPIPSGKPTQKMTYLIRGLEPSSQYEARVEAKNRFGWSRSSDSFTFYTTGMEPEVRDLGMTAYNNVASSMCTVVPLLFTALVAITWS
jgi:hypothetical protein